MPDAPERVWRLPRHSSSGYHYLSTRPEHTGGLPVTEYIRADRGATPLARMVGILQRLRGLSGMDATLMAATLVAIECEADAVLREMEETRNA